MKILKFLIPLVVFLGVSIFLFKGLSLNPREVPSPLIDKPAPAFSLPLLHENGSTLSTNDMRGQVWLLNVFASWCGPCLEEHPIIVDFSERGVIPVLGLNYKDNPVNAKRWLERHGDSYSRVVVDIDGRSGLDYGVYGVPESFLIDGDGIIRYKKIGPLSQADIEADILPLVDKYKR
jgi:cytochrome c biogenesis protein CcmG/thiol:disulfide interchange protein DsbE